MELKCTLNNEDSLKVSRMGSETLMFEIYLKGKDDDADNIIVLNGKEYEKLKEFINGGNL